MTKSKESLPTVTRAAALAAQKLDGLAAKQFAAVEREAKRVADLSENRVKGIRIVSANGRFEALVQCENFAARFDGKASTQTASCDL